MRNVAKGKINEIFSVDEKEGDYEFFPPPSKPTDYLTDEALVVTITFVEIHCSEDRRLGYAQSTSVIHR